MCLLSAGAQRVVKEVAQLDARAPVSYTHLDVYKRQHQYRPTTL